MAHASRLDRAKLLVKKAKKAKVKKGIAFRQLELQEQQEILERRNAPFTDDEMLSRMIWDFNFGSLPITRYKELLDRLNKKLETCDSLYHQSIRVEVQRRIEQHVNK